MRDRAPRSRGGADIVHLNSPALAAEREFPCPGRGGRPFLRRDVVEAMRGGPLPADFAWQIDLVGRGYRARRRDLRRRRAPSPSRRHGPMACRRRRASCATAGAVCGGLRSVAASRSCSRPGASGTKARTSPRSIVRPPISPSRSSPPDRARAERRSRRLSRTCEPLGRLERRRMSRVSLPRSRSSCRRARYEPFGLAVLEAAQAGCALVLSDIPTFRELWNGAAQFVPPGDDAARSPCAIDALRATPTRAPPRARPRASAAAATRSRPCARAILVASIGRSLARTMPANAREDAAA